MLNGLSQCGVHRSPFIYRVILRIVESYTNKITHTPLLHLSSTFFILFFYIEQSFKSVLNIRAWYSISMNTHARIKIFLFVSHIVLNVFIFKKGNFIIIIKYTLNIFFYVHKHLSSSIFKCITTEIIYK